MSIFRCQSERPASAAPAAEAGFTLVEVVVAMVLLAVLALATLPMFARGLAAASQTGTTTTATQRVAATLEEARAGATCAGLSSKAATAPTYTDAQGRTFRVTLALPNGCTPGTAVQVAVTATRGAGEELATATTMVFVAP